jgi:hypothetical protein
VVLVNKNLKYPKVALNKYKRERAIPVVDDLRTVKLPKNLQVKRLDILFPDEIRAENGDTMKRSMIRHDHRALAKAIVNLYQP